MKPLLRQLALGGLFLVAAGAASAAVSVAYDHPDKFTDLPFDQWDRDDVLKQLAAHFDTLGKALPAGQDLKIDVLDVDLAGREFPSHRAGHEIRILRGGADWPHIHLRYSLEQGGHVIKSGEAQISDMAYLDHINHYSDGDFLRYEKQMLDDWFAKTFGVGRGHR